MISIKEFRTLCRKKVIGNITEDEEKTLNEIRGKMQNIRKAGKPLPPEYTDYIHAVYKILKGYSDEEVSEAVFMATNTDPNLLL
ncbi:MAG: hypothetical protein OEZ13_13660 [Spirochaetia bacterium]|nr:hypothetical protein [Spirochaetia bacterium]